MKRRKSIEILKRLYYKNQNFKPENSTIILPRKKFNEKDLRELKSENLVSVQTDCLKRIRVSLTDKGLIEVQKITESFHNYRPCKNRPFCPNCKSAYEGVMPLVFQGRIFFKCTFCNTNYSNKLTFLFSDAKEESLIS